MNPQRGSMNVCCGIDQPNKERANRDAMPCQLLSFLPQKSLIPHLYFSNSSIQHNSHTPIKLGGSPSVSSLCFRSLSPSISLFVCFSLLHSQRFISYWRITWYDLKPLLLDIYFIVFFANFVMGEAKVRIIGLKKVCISNKMIKQC